MFILNKIKYNWKLLVGYVWKIFCIISSILGNIGYFIDKQVLELNSIEQNCIIFLIITTITLFVAMVISTIIVLLKKSKKIKLSDTKEITITYGNLFNHVFDNKDNKKRIIVVDVNTAFDTILEDSSVVNPLVSIKTIHGQWIKNMIDYGIELSDINNHIDSELNKISEEPVIKNRIKGKCKIYKRGTIIPYKLNNTTLYLFALSEFDEHNKANCNRKEFIESVKVLIEYYINNGQGEPIYMSLMGTGMSNVNLTPSESLRLLISMTRLYNDKITGDINFIVKKELEDKFSIFSEE